MKINEMRIIVTGAASGMGKHFALSLCKGGAKVAAMDVNEEGLKDVAVAASDLGGELRTYVANVASDKCIPMSDEQSSLFGIDKLNIPRSQIPAVTHVDYSARIQTVHQHTNPRFYQLLDCFEKKTDCPVLINTSFNVRGEPIVATPEDAYRCFMRSEMDYLALENILLAKTDQPHWEDDARWKEEFSLD